MHTFSAQEHAWQRELDGIELAGFRRRAFAFLIDWTIVGLFLTLFASLIALTIISVRFHHLHSWQDAVQVHSTQAQGSSPSPSIVHFQINPDDLDKLDAKKHHSLLAEITDGISDILVPILYFGILLWRGKGQTPGKRLMKIRVVSIVHSHLSFWHSVERALGYGAATLEAGFGFIQYFIHPYRRCAQDRLAETIVVTEPAYQQMLATRDPNASHEALLQ